MSEKTGSGAPAQNRRISIEDNLRKVYQDVLDEQIPDRFKNLLEQLRQNQGLDSQKADRGPSGEKGGGK